MPAATPGRRSSLTTSPEPVGRPACMEGSFASSQTSAMAARGTTQKKAPRHPMYPPRKLPSGAATMEDNAVPPCRIARARGTLSAGTSRMTAAADIDQNPPMAMPSTARPSMRIV